MRKRIGQYKIQEPNCPLGHGQSAAVYLATHVDAAQEVVALKFFHVFAPEESIQKIFLRETKIITRLNHPNIIRVFHVGFDKSNPYYVMSYAPGGNLKSKIKPGSPMSPEDVDVYLQQIANAIQHVHDSGLVHCDLKPENILISADGRLLLADFGITRSIQTIQAQSTQGAAGTPLYMAPEQFMGKPDTASDQYALGVMAYELLAGITPFTGNNAVELMGPHLNDDPPSLTAKNPAVSPLLEAVIFRALEKKTADRFPSVLDFAKSFHEAIYGSVEVAPVIPNDVTADFTTIFNQVMKRMRPDKETIIAQKKTMGQRVRQEREQRNWTPKRLAVLMNVTLSTVYRWENGEILLDDSRQLRLAKVFGKSRDELFPKILIFPDDNNIQSSNANPIFNQPTQDTSGLYPNETRIMLPGIPENIVVHNKQNSDVDPSIIGDLLKTPEGYKDAGPRWSEYYSCFILCAAQDEGFVKRLLTDLVSNGVNCSFAPMPMNASNHTRRITRESIKQSGKTLLVLSKYSVESDWIEGQAETAFMVGHESRKDILYPIFLDDSALTTKNSWRLDLSRVPYHSYFTEWQDPLEYKKSFDELLRRLRREPPQQISLF